MENIAVIISAVMNQAKDDRERMLATGKVHLLENR